MKTLKTTAEIGAYGERLAVRYLRLRGYAIRARNWRTGHLELDIVAETLRDLAVVEGKTRTYRKIDGFSQPPSSPVDADKRKMTRQAAQRYLSRSPTKKQPRMDVIEIFLQRKGDSDKYKVAKIQHFKAAY